MKLSLKTILVPAIAAFFSLTAISCNRDQCKTVVCANNGVCNGGACICQTGYEGSNCETISREKFEGVWTVFEKGSTTNAAQYTVTVSDANNITDVVFDNFNNFFTAPLPHVMATVMGDTIYIQNQQIAGKIVFGKGYIFSNVTYGQYGSISMSYEVIDSATLRVDDYGVYSSVDLSSPSAWNK